MSPTHVLEQLVEQPRTPEVENEELTHYEWKKSLILCPNILLLRPIACHGLSATCTRAVALW